MMSVHWYDSQGGVTRLTHLTRFTRFIRFTRLVAIVCLALTTADAAAQTNERIYEDLDFRFVTPGARAVGMGKTFVGLADDATAAESNPAGMSNLLEQEFSFEFIGTQIKHARFVPGATPPTQTFGDYVATPSFLSYVLPMKRWTLSFFRHDIQDYRESFGFVERALPGSGDNFEDGAFGTIVAESENHGVSGAFVVHPRLSIGGSWSWSTLSLASRARSASPEQRGDLLIESNPRNGTDTIDADSAQSMVVGLLYKPLRTVSVGATYHKKVTFEADTTSVWPVPSHPRDRRSVDARIGHPHRRSIHRRLRHAFADGAWRVVAAAAHLHRARGLDAHQLLRARDRSLPDCRLSGSGRGPDRR